MDAFEELKTKLKKYPQIHFEESESSIGIFPDLPDGFKIQLQKSIPGFTVYFEGWHESFDTSEEALNCIGFGLSDSCRLKIIMRGSFPQKWILESKLNGDWIPNSETGLIFFPFWRTKTVRYKQNRLIQET